jgi:RHS repeat-associated protein
MQAPKPNIAPPKCRSLQDSDINGVPYQYFYYTAPMSRLSTSKPLAQRCFSADWSRPLARWGETLIEEKATRPGMHFESPYRFNAKELDEEPTNGSSRTPLKINNACEQTGLYYYGARYYNPMVSVWLGVDPKAYAFPHVTSYNFLLNNPIMMVDPGGDSTVYYNTAGEILYTSHDQLENAISIIPDENLMAFNDALEKNKDALEDPLLRNMVNSKLRNYGVNYSTNSIDGFWKRSIGDGDLENGNYLYENEFGLIVVGAPQDDIVGTQTNIIWPKPPSNSVGDIHTHECLFCGTNPSTKDVNRNWGKIKFKMTKVQYFDIVVSQNEIIFHNQFSSSNPLIIINKKKLFEK